MTYTTVDIDGLSEVRAHLNDKHYPSFVAYINWLIRKNIEEEGARYIKDKYLRQPEVKKSQGKWKNMESGEH